MSEANDIGVPADDPVVGDGTVDAALDPKVVSRRDALKKAAIGAGIAGAVWSAPRIEGLSLVPDYAAAGTIPPGSTIVIKASSADCSATSNLRNCWGNCVGTDQNDCSPFRFTAPAYAPAMASGSPSPALIMGTPSQYTSANMLSNPAPPGPNQNEFFDVVWSGAADKFETGMAALMFSLNPPFNMCSVTGISGQVFDTTTTKAPWPAAGTLTFANTPGTVPSPGGPIPAVVGANATFSANGNANIPVPTAQGADVTITITCT